MSNGDEIDQSSTAGDSVGLYVSDESQMSQRLALANELPHLAVWGL